MTLPESQLAHLAPQRAGAGARSRPVRSIGLRTPQVPARIRWLLGALIFSAFFSGMKLVPGLGNNVGPFEVVTALLILVFVFDPANRHQLRLTTLSRILLTITFMAALSQVYILPENALSGFVQTLILVHLLLVVVVFHNLAQRYLLTPTRLLTLVTLAVLVVGPWVIFSGLSSGGDIQASGPFRNRAHMATYMLTAFWMVTIFLLLPRVRTKMRLAGAVAAATCLYSIAVSGRRSVYIALVAGLAGLVLAFILARRGKRLRMFALAGLAVVFIGAFYVYGPLVFPQAAFFQDRVGTVGDRLKAFVAPAGEGAAADNFYLLQRQGVMLAVRESPLVGIGWGGFGDSPYSPTGHEVHSMPLRFLAELGIIGLLLYLCLLGHLVTHSIRLFLRMRQTPYSASYLALAVAVCSLCISYVYNRHITERTFWLFLAVFLSMHVFSEIANPSALRRVMVRRPVGGRAAPPRGAAGAPPAPAFEAGAGARRPAVSVLRRGGAG